MLICNGTWMTMVLIWMKSKIGAYIDYKHGLEEILVFDEDWNEHKGGNDKMI
jgi:hypothetical protein